MREARIIMPMAVHVMGHVRIHAELERELAAKAGGYTATTGIGGWLNKRGELIRENVVVYDVAADGDAHNRTLRDIAIRYGRQLRQEAVYVRYASGNVDIIDITSISILDTVD